MNALHASILPSGNAARADRLRRPDNSAIRRGPTRVMRILKFGGTSVGGADEIRRVVDIVRRAESREATVVVVSALSGVTNGLIEAARAAARGDASYPDAIDALEARHADVARAVVNQDERPALTNDIARAFADLRSLLQGASLLRECTPRTLDSIGSLGELLSAPIVAAALRSSGIRSKAVDARELIVTDETFGSARPDFEATSARIRGRLAAWDRAGDGVPVVTGFVAATPNGETTTLGRGGSDYTAAILGAALDATAVEIWTDVDGVMTADPRRVPEAQPIDALTYEELLEVSHFGARVVHPPTVHPARLRGIPLAVRNTFRPDSPGTWIRNDAPAARDGVRSLASISRVALARLEGDGMVGVPGIAERLFGALAREGASVILISQASSEHSICFAIDPASIPRVTRAVNAAFALERASGLVDDLIVEDDASIVAVVGSGMRDRPGTAGKIFGILGRCGVNVRAIAQGSSELNISLVVSREDETRALQAIHGALFSKRRDVAVFIAGLGRVGRELAQQIDAAAADRERRLGLRLNLRGVATSSRMLFGPALAAENLRARVDTDGIPLDLATLADAARAEGAGNAVFVDCSASDEPGRHFAQLLESGVHVVSANKRAFASDSTTWAAIKRPHRPGRGLVLHETTVGAALPVLSTLSDLVRTGDRILKIEGALSGTMSFLFARIAEGVSFSAAVREADAIGYTEPDPRDDLGGVDVARKALILAREAFGEFDADRVRRESLVPPAFDGLTLAAFWERLAEADRDVAQRAASARRDGRSLAYLATIAPGAVDVGIREVAADSPFATLRAGENLIAFWTERYRDLPLVVRGPGAGPALTASGVLADILRVSLTGS